MGSESNRELSRTLLVNLSTTLLNAPRPFGVGDGFAPQVAAAALDVLNDYLSVRLNSINHDHVVGMVGADIASHLLNDIITGFQSALIGRNPNLLANIFGPEDAVDLVKLVASHVALSPHLLVKAEGNEEIQAVVKAIAQAIASDESGLMTVTEWKGIAAIALDTALLNPGRLLGLNAERNNGQALAVTIISKILASASADLKDHASAPGHLLFGQTLTEILRITLITGANGALSVIKDQTRIDDHLGALQDFIAQLHLSLIHI